MQTGTYSYPPMERVIYGRPFAEALAEEVARLGAGAVFLMAGGTLSRETDVVRQVQDALGARLAGVWTRMGAHSPRTDVVAAANAAREAKADLIVTLGGGSVTDGAKMVGFCLGNEVTDPAQLDAFAARMGPDGKLVRPPAKPSPLRSIAIPTTLSAGEFSATAGCTDTVRQVKQSYAHPTMMPRVVILDPAVTRHTPEWLFLSTGIRAVDHAVEDLCSTNSQPFSDGASLHALRLLSRGLPAVHDDPTDLAARLDCQLGAWMSMAGSQAGVMKGASHGIGHMLGGTAGVPHGYTSCVMLPHVLRFNAPVNAERQRWVSEAMGRPGMAAGDVVAELVARLGLPRRLRDLGVPAELLDRIAAESMHDRYIPANPRPIRSATVVRHLLDLAW